MFCLFQLAHVINFCHVLKMKKAQLIIYSNKVLLDITGPSSETSQQDIGLHNPMAQQ